MMRVLFSFLLFLFSAGFVLAQDSETLSNFNLRDSLDSVLRNHKLIEASKIDSKAAKLRVKQSKGGFFPSLDICYKAQSLPIVHR